MLSSKIKLSKLADEALGTLLDNMNALAGAIIIEREGELQLISSIGISAPEGLVDNFTQDFLFM